MTVEQLDKANAVSGQIMRRKWRVEDLSALIKNVEDSNEPCKLGGLAGGLEIPKGIVLGLLRREKRHLMDELKQLHVELMAI